MKKIALIAGETSGDQLGGWLMAALKQQQPDISLIGIGGVNMEAQGLQSLFPMRELALFGFAEILPHAFRLLKRIRETVAFIEREQPDVLVTIDSPGFVFRVIRRLRARGKARPRFIHYVAPTVWAYKPERAAKTAKLVDRLLVLLPFEPPYFEREGLTTDFVGHEIAWWWREKGDGTAFRARHHIAGHAPLLAVFPGSRMGELNRLLPIFAETVRRLALDIPDLEVVMQVPDALLSPLREKTAGWPVKTHLLSNREDKKPLFAAATAALAKSGTISLECALARLPSIVAYKVNRLSAWLARRMITIPYFAMANILLKREIQPEFIQEHCRADRLTAALLPLLNHANARAAQLQHFTHVAVMLGAEDAVSPSTKAARIILA